VSVAGKANLLDELVGYRPMNDNAKDRIGNNHGTLEGGAGISVDAESGSVLKVNGTNSAALKNGGR
jgi:hypothetical protein